MQTLKDTATLVVLILLALTLRVDSGGEPVGLDLSTPAEAAVEPASTEPGPVVLPAVGCRRSEGPKPLRVVPKPEFEIDTDYRTERRLVWEQNGRRIVVVLGVDGTAAIEAPSDPDAPLPCNETIQAHLSS